MATQDRRPAPRRRARRDDPRQREAQRKKRAIILGVEIIVILLMLVVVIMAIRGEGIFKVLSNEAPTRVELNEGEIQEKMNETVLENETLKGYRNIALFGVDSTTGALEKGTRSDTIIIASINQDTKEVKLCSVYRDTYLNKGNDKYGKCNAAYANGGPKQAMMMLNMNLDLNITDFVTVGFQGLTDAIDALGGVWIDVDEEEIKHINNYQMCIAENLKRPYTEVTTTGYQLLDGLQATAYCRIRYTKGDDYMRTFRQREVIKACMEQAKKANVTSLNKIAEAVFPEVYTSLNLEEILTVLGEVAQYKIVADDGLPFEQFRGSGTIGANGSCVVPVDLASNVKELHRFLFDETDYQVSEEITKYSDVIKGDTQAYLN
ncbi:MAG: LytR family transcriptional regulator [Lachnospiraceae bacterium]|jgi:LCP family protein required for cell wall assembly|nr:LytR family transcriptional regulator [Lachnospiraceae bacterium]